MAQPSPPIVRLRRARASLAAMLATLLSMSGAHAATHAAPRAASAAAANDVDARYRQEVQACNSGQSHQDKATCLKEAGAAREEGRRQRLESGQSSSTLRANALARCDAQPAADREACRARIEGDAKISGSATQGGVLREHVQREAAPAASAASTPK